MKVVTVANLKGGTAKSTTAVYLAHAWAEAGLRVLVVDADPQGSVLRWSDIAGWDTVQTVGLAVRDIYRRLPDLAGNADLVVIDTPPMDEQAAISYSAIRAGDVVVIPMAPTTAELDRLPDMLDAVAEVEPLRETPPRVVVMLNRTVANAASTGQIRASIEQRGIAVLDATIPRREAIAQSFGRPVTHDDAYAGAAAEIKELL